MSFCVEFLPVMYVCLFCLSVNIRGGGLGTALVRIFVALFSRYLGHNCSVTLIRFMASNQLYPILARKVRTMIIVKPFSSVLNLLFRLLI